MDRYVNTLILMTFLLQRIESLGAGLVDLHQSMIHAGKNLFTPPGGKEKRHLSRQLSPCIVITDTEKPNMQRKLQTSSSVDSTAMTCNIGSAVLS